MSRESAGNLAEQHVREFARAGVRAGLLSDADLRREVVEAVAAELPDRDAEQTADAWIAEAREELRVDQESWPEATDYERLQSAFSELELSDVVVLQGIEDHWEAKRLLQERASGGELRLSEIAGLFWHCLAQRAAITRDQVGEAVMRQGLAASARPLRALLSQILQGTG